jgi:hypothetical protein
VIIPVWGSFDTEDGLVRNLASLIRTGDCTLDLDPNTGALIVAGHLGLSVLHVSNYSTVIYFFFIFISQKCGNMFEDIQQQC